MTDRAFGDTPEQMLAAVLVGTSPAMRHLRARIARVAPRELTILIQGPSGSGKELVARGIHRLSGRTGRFVALNVCAIPESLFEATLVGHAKGAFTGATGNAPGLLVEADGGTLFLDEIGGLPLAAQAKLLRLIEGHAFHALGDTRERRSNFRVVAATNDDLVALVRTGRFRADLLFRLRGAVLDVPPLASRLEDVPELVRHFLHSQRSAQHPRLADSALHVLQDYSWPGNVRQLRAVVERVVALADSPLLDVAEVYMALEPELASERIWAEPDDALPHELLQALGASGGDTAEAARLLGVSRRTIYRRLEESGLPTPKRRHRKGNGLLAEEASRRAE